MRETTVPQFEDKTKVIKDSINYNVPFVFQNHINQCGDACVYMLLLYYGLPHTSTFAIERLELNPSFPGLQVFRIRKNDRGVLKGSTTDDLVERMDNFIRIKDYENKYLCKKINEKYVGLKTNNKFLSCFYLKFNNRDEIKKQLETFGPFIIQINELHFALVKGLEENSVIIHDPWRGGNRKMDVDKFISRKVNINKESEVVRLSYGFLDLFNNIPDEVKTAVNYLKFRIQKANSAYTYRSKSSYPKSTDRSLNNVTNKGVFNRHGNDGVKRLEQVYVEIIGARTSSVIFNILGQLFSKTGSFEGMSGSVQYHTHSGASYLINALFSYYNDVNLGIASHDNDTYILELKSILESHLGTNCFGSQTTEHSRRKCGEIIIEYGRYAIKRQHGRYTDKELLSILKGINDRQSINDARIIAEKAECESERFFDKYSDKNITSCGIEQKTTKWLKEYSYDSTHIQKEARSFKGNPEDISNPSFHYIKFLGIERVLNYYHKYLNQYFLFYRLTSYKDGKNPYLNIYKGLEGKLIQERGFMSVSLHRRFLIDGVNNAKSCISYNKIAIIGRGALNFSKYSAYNNSSDPRYVGQAEFIFPRNTVMKILSICKVKNDVHMICKIDEKEKTRNGKETVFDSFSLEKIV
ncbi:cysteine peptidase family C39 domain-containing protein [Francisella uliginis]|nr:papain-like cysteine protease family protein [Francisella uliginis]